MRTLSRLIAISLYFTHLALHAETVRLVTPNLSDENIIGYNVGLRPYRSSGIRIEAEKYEGKSLIHNYGHGGAGISLSWGSAQEAIRLMEAHYAPEYGSTIAIIGSGVNGLTVANQLLDKGYRVRIYAKDFPPHTTSEVAAGFWSPFGVAVANTPEAQQQYDAIRSSSREHFYNLASAQVPEFNGVSNADLFSFNKNQSSTDSTSSLVDVEFDNGRKLSALRSRRIIIETPIYTQDLMTKAQAKGAEFFQHFLVEGSELLEFQEDIIFNCMGLGSREIFHDQDLRPVRGQLVYFKAQEGINYLAAAPGQNEIFIAMLPYKDKLILGGSYEEGEEQKLVSNKIIEDILQNARAFFEPKPSDHDEL